MKPTRQNSRVISLVPSWTETFLAAGINIVGKTHFCIHPDDKISSIPSVGGTKNLHMEAIMNLRPDYVILDEQENKLEMAEQLRANSIKILTSNVTDFDSVIQFLQSMADILDESKLNEFAERYKSVIGRDQISTEKFWAQILLKGDVPDAKSAIDYVIWKDPFMVIGQNTFIANNLKLVGFNLDRSEKYPEVAETELRQRFCLFSSEPYRFDRKFEKMILSGFQGALVDGEKLSWYGIRNLCFLESCL